MCVRPRHSTENGLKGDGCRTPVTQTSDQRIPILRVGLPGRSFIKGGEEGHVIWVFLRPGLVLVCRSGTSHPRCGSGSLTVRSPKSHSGEERILICRVVHEIKSVRK